MKNVTLVFRLSFKPVDEEAEERIENDLDEAIQVYMDDGINSDFKGSYSMEVTKGYD